MFLIHNFTNCNTTYAVYFSANDPCSFGGVQSFRCQVVSTRVILIPGEFVSMQASNRFVTTAALPTIHGIEYT